LVQIILSVALIIRKCSEHGLIEHAFLGRTCDIVVYPRKHTEEIDSLPERWRPTLFDFDRPRRDKISAKCVLDWLIHDRYLLLYDPEGMSGAEEAGFSEYGIKAFAFASDRSVKNGLYEMGMEAFFEILDGAAQQL
jgi:hypothetical protein